MYNPKPNTVTDRIYCMKVKNLPLRTTGNCSFWGQILVNGWCENIHVLEDKMSAFLFFLSYIFFTHTNLKLWNFNFNHQHFWHTVTGLSAQKHKHPAKYCRWTCISTACCHAYLWGSEQRVCLHTDVAAAVRAHCSDGANIHSDTDVLQKVVEWWGSNLRFPTHVDQHVFTCTDLTHTHTLVQLHV